MNFARDVVDAAPPDRPALVALGRDGSRREIAFGAVADRSARLAGTLLARGVGPGDVVLTLIGNRPEWVEAMIACFRIGAVVLPCNEQLRARDLRLRLAVAEPALILADERNLPELEGAGPACPVLAVPDEGLYAAAPAPAAELAPEDPCLIVFTSGTSGEPKAVIHLQRYLPGQQVQAEHWFGPRAGDSRRRHLYCRPDKVPARTRTGDERISRTNPDPCCSRHSSGRIQTALISRPTRS